LRTILNSATAEQCGHFAENTANSEAELGWSFIFLGSADDVPNRELIPINSASPQICPLSIRFMVFQSDRFRIIQESLHLASQSDVGRRRRKSNVKKADLGSTAGMERLWPIEPR